MLQISKESKIHSFEWESLHGTYTEQVLYTNLAALIHVSFWNRSVSAQAEQSAITVPLHTFSKTTVRAPEAVQAKESEKNIITFVMKLIK